VSPVLKSQFLDVKRIRLDFPILKRRLHGKRLSYLDNAATTQKPGQVIDALVDYYSRYNANVHRSVHQLGIEATEAYENSRKAVASFIDARSPREIVFTRGTTESINLVRYAWGQSNVQKGDTIVLTIMEHHSNLVPWLLLAKQTGAELRFVDIDENGLLRMDEFEDALRTNPKLVTLTQCSNVLGTINDAAGLTRKAKKVGATVLVDGAQSVPHMPVSAQEIGSDFLVFSGHKMLGPTGIGVLVGKKEVLETMEPFQSGGEMIKEVHTTGAKWNDVPYKFEAGTTNIADAIGLGAAIQYLRALGMDRIRGHEVELLGYAIDLIEKEGGITIYGPGDPKMRGGVISFNLADIHPHDLATILDGEGVAMRSGHHCAQPLMERLNVPATSRISLYVYNSYDDIDAFVQGIRKAKGIFRI
jgi:cysteine desulfurase/selenocysteine lyase